MISFDNNFWIHFNISLFQAYKSLVYGIKDLSFSGFNFPWQC